MAFYDHLLDVFWSTNQLGTIWLWGELSMAADG
jgi:hypothetical protein